MKGSNLSHLKNNKSFFISLMTGMVMASAIIYPTQSAANSCPTATHSEVSFTVSEDIGRQVLSGTPFGMRDSDRDIINYVLDSHLRGYWGPLFSVRNKNSYSTSGTQYAEITYEGSGFNYETAPVFDDGRRGYKVRLYGFDSDSSCETPIEIIVYVTDAPEIYTMSGSIRTSGGNLVGHTLTADFSQVFDSEGLNDLTVTWSREACPSFRGIGTWPLNRAVKSDSSSYQIVSEDRGHRISVWGQYQTDADHFKWVCENLGLIPDLPEIVYLNNAPDLSYSPVYYIVRENTGSGTLSTDRNNKTPDMIDVDQDTISYSISIPDGTDSNIAEAIRSIFKVSNTAPDPSSRDSEQPIEITYNKSFNYETTPELEHGKGYEFDIKGCDPDDACDTMTVIVEVEDEVEFSTISGSVRITGSNYAGGTLTADLSGISDSEGVQYLYLAWRRGACTASKGVGDLPETQSSGDPYQEIGDSHSYTIQPGDYGQIVSVWGQYQTDTNHSKWVCHQTSIARNTSWPNISITSSRQTVPAKENIEITLHRPNYLTDDLPVHLRSVNGDRTENFTKTIPAGERQVVFSVQAHNEGELKVEVRLGSGYNAPSSPITVTVTTANIQPSGNPSITGTPQVEETLTADTSTIMDENGISRSFSYTWWKEVSFDPNAGIPQQISGATGSTYTINQADARAKIKVKVSYRDDDGFNHVLESALTGEVTPAANTKPYVLGIVLKNDYTDIGHFVTPGSNFEASVGNIMSIIVYMSEGVSGLSATHGEARMRLNIGSQTRTLYRSPFSGESSPNKLRFHYTVEEGVSGGVTIPHNGMFIEGAYVGVVSNPSNVNLNYPQTYLGNMRVQSSLNMSIVDATVYENTSRYVDFTVRLNRNATETITVDWATSDGTAKAGSDYTADSGTLTFNSGDKINTIRVYIIDDTIEEERETFQVNLSNLSPSSVQFADANAIGTIVNSDPDVSNNNNQQQQIEDPPPLPPITASFIGMPSEHDGINSFTFELRFSEDIKGLSYKTLKNSAFQVTNGSIKKARRLARLANQRWEITVQPSNNNDISIMLPPTTDCSTTGAICHSDGRKLNNGRAGLIQGPVGISVADASANENTDSTVDFTVSLSRSSANTITVNYATQDGSATAGQDYTSKSGTLTFTAGETSKTVSVSVLSDSIDEGNETFKLKLSSPSGAVLTDSEATGTIENSDPMPSAWLSRFGRTVGGQAVDAISSRMGKTAEGNQVVIGGVEMSMTEETKGANLQNIHQQFESSKWSSDTQMERGLNNQEMTLEELVLGTSFNLGMKNKDTGNTWSAWGQVANDRFKGEEDEVSVEGKVTSGFLGADVTSGNWRGGLAVSASKGKGTFRSLENDSPEDNGEVKSELTSLYPYFGYEFGEKKSIWGIFGIGEGNVTVTQFANENRSKNQTTEADISMRMGAVGAKGPILSQSEGNRMDMTLQTDGMYVRTDSDSTEGMKGAETEVTRLRLMIDSSRSFKTGQGGAFTPSFQMGVRHDGGDAEEGVGLEAGLAALYEAGGLTLEGSVRKLLAHEESGYEEWGASAALRLDPGKSGRGLSLNISPTWGKSSSGVDNLWSAQGTHQLGRNGDFEAENRLEAEIGYGIFNPFKNLFGVLTPYFALSLGDENRAYRTGTRWKISDNANLGLELNRTKGEEKENDDKAIMLKGGFQW